MRCSTSFTTTAFRHWRFRSRRRNSWPCPRASSHGNPSHLPCALHVDSYHIQGPCVVSATFGTSTGSSPPTHWKQSDTALRAFTRAMSFFCSVMWKLQYFWWLPGTQTPRSWVLVAPRYPNSRSRVLVAPRYPNYRSGVLMAPRYCKSWYRILNNLLLFFIITRK